MESRKGGFRIGRKKGALEDITMRGNGSHVEDRKEKEQEKEESGTEGVKQGQGKG